MRSRKNARNLPKLKFCFPHRLNLTIKIYREKDPFLLWYRDPAFIKGTKNKNNFTDHEISFIMKKNLQLYGCSVGEKAC
jgi:hypothetical protein